MNSVSRALKDTSIHFVPLPPPTSNPRSSILMGAAENGRKHDDLDVGAVGYKTPGQQKNI